MNLIDRFAKAVSPGWAVSRERARRQLKAFSREAAQSNGNRRMASQSFDHPDSSRNHSDRVTCMREARNLVENEAVCASLMRMYGTYAIGRLSYQPASGNSDWDRAAKTYVALWMRYADFSQRHSLPTMAKQALKSVIRDGDVGQIVHLDNDLEKIAQGICPVRLQPIEADRIGSVGSRLDVGRWPKLGDNERDFSGVIVNGETGAPVAYRVYKRRQDELALRYDADIQVPAERFHHIFDTDRPDAYRGFSWFTQAINDIKDQAEILGMEKIAVKLLSSITGTMKNVDTEDDINLDDNASVGSDGAVVKSVEAGRILHLADDQDFTDLSPDRPSATFSGFLEFLIRRTCMSLRLPFGFVWSWAGQGTAVRMEAAQAAREFDEAQQMMEHALLDPVVRRVIATGIELGHLAKNRNWAEGEWRYPARPTADMGRESKAMVDEVMAGMMSKTQHAQNNGEDYEIIRNNRKREAKELIEDAKLIMEASDGEIDMKTAIYMLERRAPNAPVEQPAQDNAGADA